MDIHYQCSDERLNQIYDICIRTARLCMLDTYVDCATWEQGFWTGDCQIASLINLLNFGEWAFDQLGIDEDYYALLEKRMQWHVAPQLGSALESPERKGEDPECLTIAEGFVRRHQKSPCILIEIPEYSLMNTLSEATAGMDVVSIFLMTSDGGFLQTGETINPFEDWHNLKSGDRLQTAMGCSFPCVLVESDCFQIGVFFDDSALLRPVVLLRRWMLILFSLCLTACVVFA